MGIPEGATLVYACPMHPEVVSDEPGKCPKCGMETLATAASAEAAAGQDITATGITATAMKRVAGKEGMRAPLRGMASTAATTAMAMTRPTSPRRESNGKTTWSRSTE